MTITKQDVARCIEANPLLHGVTAHGLAVRKKHDPPRNYPEALDQDMLATIGRAVEWLTRPLDEGGCISIRESIRPGGTSYGLKHHFSSDTGDYIPNGAFIIALAMAGCKLKRVNFGSLNAKSSAWPSHEAVWRMAFSHERIGAREKLADSETVRRHLLQAFARAATGTEIAARPGFWEWVCERRAPDNPRGDFVRDARAIRDDRNGEEGWHEACLLRLAVACAYFPWNPDVVEPMAVFKHWARRFMKDQRKG